MDTEVTNLGRDWVELTAAWAAAMPPAADGEAITVQPGDQGPSHAIEVIQAAAAPVGTDRGHLLAAGDTLTVTGAGGRKHYGRAYMGSAEIVATGEGLTGDRGGGGGVSGGVSGGGGGDLTLIHSPAVFPAAERMAAVPGQIRGSVALDIGDLSPFQAVSDGTLTIGSETVMGIDLSGVTTINEVITALNAAIGANAGLASYAVSLPFINPTFYGGIRRSDGDVEAVSGTLEPLFGWAAPAETIAHEAASPAIVLPARAGGGDWSHLMIRALGQSYRGQYWYSQSDFWALAGASISNYLAFNNSSGWATQSFSDPAGGEIVIGVARAYNVSYFSLLYDPATRTVSWRAERTLPTQSSWAPSIDTLTVLAR